MDRKETTKLLTDTLIRTRLSDRKYYAKEVTLDYGTNHPKRVDVMQFKPGGVTYASDMEKGIFICYEIKSCVEDIFSGNGLNFYGEQNYIVTTAECYKKMLQEDRMRKLYAHIKEKFPESATNFGFMVLVPYRMDLKDNVTIAEFINNPERVTADERYQLAIIIPSYQRPRRRSTIELMFCMLRAKHNYTNYDE